jgi:PAS domain S-box-containing protein
MSENRNHQGTKQEAPPFDALTVLGRMGIKSLRMKLFVAGALFAVVSLILVCSIAYWSVGPAINSSGGAGQTESPVLGRILLGAVPVLLVLGACAYFFSVSIASAVREILRTIESALAGDLTARALVRSGDELEQAAEGLSRLVTLFNETSQAGHEHKQAFSLISSAVDSSSDGIAIRDLVRSDSHFNRALSEILGYSREQLAKTEASLELYNDPSVGKDVIGSLDGGTAWSGDVELKTSTGQVVPVALRANPIKDETGKIIGRVSIYTDVTDRKRLETTLAQTAADYRTVFESAGAPILIFDPGTEELLDVNNRTCQIHGFDRQEMIGMNLKTLTTDVGQRGQAQKEALGEEAASTISKMRTKWWDKFFDEASKEGVANSFETKHTRKDGTPVYLLGSTSPIQYRGKRAILGVASDITQRKQGEKLLEGSLGDFLHLVSIVSEGDMTERGNDGEGPMAAVSNALNRMMDNFSGMLTRVKQIGLSVTSSATQILAASEEIAAGAQRQADEITNTSSAVEEMAASMSQVSRNAEASAAAARRALGMAEHGDRSVRDTSEAMNRIDSAVQGTAEKMRLLAKRSSEISEIIDLINDVAAQTNLLSLNAAIEAAHAGEAGLGFSVVADEIRKLAERSARATRDVGALIKAIQNETSEALDAMENGMKQVQDGSTLAEQARQSLQDISQVVRQSAELIEEISAASEEQARVTRNLAGAMQTVSSITLETSAGAHETAQTIQGMVSLSEQLNDAISQFKVKDNFAHPFSYENSAPGSRGMGNGSSMSGHHGAD